MLTSFIPCDGSLAKARRHPVYKLIFDLILFSVFHDCYADWAPSYLWSGCSQELQYNDLPSKMIVSDWFCRESDDPILVTTEKMTDNFYALCLYGK